MVEEPRHQRNPYHCGHFLPNQQSQSAQYSKNPTNTAHYVCCVRNISVPMQNHLLNSSPPYHRDMSRPNSRVMVQLNATTSLALKLPNRVK